MSTLPTSLEFQKRFISLIDRQNENRSFIAQSMGLNYVTFSKIYNYGIVPKPIVLIRIADFFNVSVEFLLAKAEKDYFKKSENPQSFIVRLNELMKENRIKNYSALGNLIHIHRNSFYEWDNRNYIPSLEILELLADFFNISIDYLLGRTDERK